MESPPNLTRCRALLCLLFLNAFVGEMAFYFHLKTVEGYQKELQEMGAMNDHLTFLNGDKQKVDSLVQSLIEQRDQFKLLWENSMEFDPELMEKIGMSWSPPNIVVLATTSHLKYSFYLPITVALWNARFGFKGLIFLVGDERAFNTRPYFVVIRRYLEILGCRTVILHCAPELAISVSQSVRLFASYLPGIKNSTFMVTSDTELWALDTKMFDLLPRKKLLLRNADCCGSFDHNGATYPMFPMGYIGTDASTWREIMNAPFLSNMTELVISEATKYYPIDFLTGVQKGGRGWYLDQCLISIKIQNWGGYPDLAQTTSYFEMKRIDRNAWPKSITQEMVDSSTDCHTLLDAWVPETWSKVSELLKLVLDANHFKLINSYHQEILNAITMSDTN